MRKVPLLNYELKVNYLINRGGGGVLLTPEIAVPVGRRPIAVDAKNSEPPRLID